MFEIEIKNRKIKNTFINLSLLLFTVFLFLGLAEGGMRLFSYVDGVLTGQGTCQGPDPFQPSRLSDTMHIAVDTPLGLGYVLKPNSREIFLGTEVVINSLGFRDYEYSLEKPRDTYRIAVLGDSVTFGHGVNLEETYPKILEQNLRQVLNKKNAEVLNFGVRGYSLKQELILLKEKVLAYNPDLIIIGHHPNDIYSPVYRIEEIIPVPQLAFITQHLCLFKPWRENEFKKSINNPPYPVVYQEDSKTWENHKNLFRNISVITQKKRIPTLVVILPEWRNLDSAYEFKDIHAFLERAIVASGLYSLDMWPRVRGLKGSEYAISPQDYDHPNFKGHEKIAEAIYNKLREESLLPENNVRE